MDPKWMPDYIRIIDGFPVTDTHKIVVRPYKKEHYNLENNPACGSITAPRGHHLSPLTPEKYQAMKACFIENGRDSLLG